MDADGLAERRCVNHRSVADIEAHAVDFGVGIAVENEVTRQQLR
jgi:hypothetical protein